MLYFLVGYMGCGKTTLGRKLAKRLGVPFVDTDERVEQAEGATVADIFRYQGEAYFREAERRVLEDIIEGMDAGVIATGGGLPTWGDNMERMNAVGRTIYIERSASQIAKRLTPYGRQKRPALQGLDDAALVRYIDDNIERRRTFYERASVTLAASRGSDEELLKEMLKWTTEV